MNRTMNQFFFDVKAAIILSSWICVYGLIYGPEVISNALTNHPCLGVHYPEVHHRASFSHLPIGLLDYRIASVMINNVFFNVATERNVSFMDINSVERRKRHFIIYWRIKRGNTEERGVSSQKRLRLAFFF